MVKNPPAMRETGFDLWVGKIPWRRAWQPTPVFLPGESPWTEEAGGLQSIVPQRVGHDWMTKYTHTHTHTHTHTVDTGFPGGTSSKEPACQRRRFERSGFDPWVGSPGGGHSNSFRYSYMENPMNRGAWRATVHRVRHDWSHLAACRL